MGFRIGGSRSKQIIFGTYTRRELIDIVEGKIELTQFDEKKPRIIKTNKLESITEMVFSLDELDDTNNLENGLPSNTSFMHDVATHEDSTHFKPYTPQYKKLKKGDLVSLVLRMKHMKNNIMANGLVTTVVLHIQYLLIL